MKSNSDLCITCFSANKNGFGIFTECGEKLEAGAIIRQHFGFEVVETDVHTKFICWKCWCRIEDFHALYKSAQEFHANFALIQSETETDSMPVDNYMLEEECDSNEWDNSETDIKPEPMASINLDIDDNFTDIGDNSLERPHSIKLEEDVDDNLVMALESVAHTPDSDSDSKNGSVSATVNQPSSLEQKQYASKRDFWFDKVTRQLAQYNKLDMNCDLCMASFESFVDVKAHYKTKHSHSLGYLKCCGQRLRTLNDMKDHVEWHRNPNIFKCQHCSRVFGTRVNLKSHSIHHEPETNQKLKCTKCSKTFLRKYQLNAHCSKMHTEIEDCIWECDICKKNFAKYSSMQNHIIKNHVRVQPCKFCGEKIGIGTQLRKHMQSKHRIYEDRTVAMIRQLAQYKGLDLKCDFCDATVQSLYEARAHYEKEHNYKYGYIKCCGSRLKEPSRIISHIKWHRDPNVFNCQECGKTFDNKYSLSYHKITHDPGKNRKYECTECDLAFLRESSLTKHFRRTHTENDNCV